MTFYGAFAMLYHVVSNMRSSLLPAVIGANSCKAPFRISEIHSTNCKIVLLLRTLASSPLNDKMGKRIPSLKENKEIPQNGQKLKGSKLLSFKEFQLTVEPFDEFCESKSVKILCGDDRAKLIEAYEDYCKTKYNRYKWQHYGGNPALMI